PQLASLRAQERQLVDEITTKRAAAAAARAAADKPAPAPRAVVVQTPPADKDKAIAAATDLGPPKSVQDAPPQYHLILKKYSDLDTEFQKMQVEMQTAEAAYKNRYKVTRPAETPAAPKRPVGLIAIVIGILATIAAVLLVAGLADRFSGIFFEPRDVRD